ncbi:TMEM115 family protein [Megaselia abdita]
MITNAKYFQQQIKALLKNTSNVITIILTITVVGYFIGWSETALKNCVIIPGFMSPPTFSIWTTVTFCFIELHWYEVVVDFVSLSLCAKLLEPLWGRKEMLKFFGIINLGVAFLSMFYYLLLYASTRNSKFLFEVQIHGLAGFIASLSVAVRQILPDHLILKTKWGFVTNRHVPLMIVLFSIMFWSLNVFDGTNPVMLCAGALCSWIYLRFFQKHYNGRGDSSENFSFASFFPTFMQKYLNVVLNPIYICCLRFGVIKKPETSKLPSNSSQLMMVSVADPHDIERRRQIAMKALNDRLKHTGDNSRTSVPRSFPRPNTGGGVHSHSHHHHQHPSQMDKSQPPPHMVFTKDSVFVPPAIALPYEPLSQASESKVSNSKSTSETLIDLN